MREAIKDLIIKAIVLTCVMIVIPLCIAYYIDNWIIYIPVVFTYGIFIACFFEIK